MEMYYVREYTPTCRFLKIINLTLTWTIIVTQSMKATKGGDINMNFSW